MQKFSKCKNFFLKLSNYLDDAERKTGFLIKTRVISPLGQHDSQLGII